MEKIEKRLLLASEADFVICLYTPASHKRHDYLKKACELMLQHKSPDTVCGIVKNIGREGESSGLCGGDCSIAGTAPDGGHFPGKNGPVSRELVEGQCPSFFV